MDDYFLALEALASCAIEGNELAIELLKLKDSDHEKFILELHKRGWIGKEA